MGTVISIDEDRRKSENAIERLRALVENDMQRVNETIISNAHSPVARISEVAEYLIALGGKRLRPMMTLAAARLCNYTGSKHVDLATAVEFIHTATLLHDDVVDESVLRRGAQTANMVWDNQNAVLVGDFLFSRSFQLMVKTDSLRVLEVLSNAAAVIAEGEVMQLTTAKNLDTTEDAYLEVISAKTAALFAAASQVGAIISERPKAEEDALESYGRNLGVAYQLVDDALDYSAAQATLGKTVGDDFREGKITLPVILAFRRGNDEERAFWKRTQEERDQRDNDLEQALHLMGKHDTLKDTLTRARHYGDIARDALAIFPDIPEKEALCDVVDFVVDRSY